MPRPYLELLHLAEGWKTEGRTAEQAAFLAAELGESTVRIALMLCHAFYMIPQVAMPIALQAKPDERYEQYTSRLQPG
ncbi:hypothetical protein [Deinococcus sp. RIT780]|uniref:hypothetical protein n=1 Tax=Deinococcus sp. RIT780 TaxID=2870472 RepID=UPI001C8AA9B7|nr:hypothetical protein [Deinococcus sp. RIT780]MBX8464594.1 hypothetical protein [Deinococcus sp. RIT780]